MNDRIRQYLAEYAALNRKWGDAAEKAEGGMAGLMQQEVAEEIEGFLREDLKCVGCGTPRGTALSTPICLKFEQQDDGEGRIDTDCATCGHNSDCHEPVRPAAMGGVELYALYEEACAQNGCGVDSWEDLDGPTRFEWEYMGERLTQFQING